MRYGIFVHDPDGDSGYGRIVGPFRSVERADEEADKILRIAERRDFYVECIVLPLADGLSATTVVDRIQEESW